MDQDFDAVASYYASLASIKLDQCVEEKVITRGGGEVPWQELLAGRQRQEETTVNRAQRALRT